jgi:hypothetical protein
MRMQILPILCQNDAPLADINSKFGLVQPGFGDALEDFITPRLTVNLNRSSGFYAILMN